MSITYRIEIRELQLRDPFGIARNTRTSVRNLFIRIGDGWGEGAPVYYKGQDVETMRELAEECVPQIDVSAPPPATLRYLQERYPDQSALHQAIDLALHDHHARQANQPLWQLWKLNWQAVPPSTFTIGLDSVDVMVDKVRQAARFPWLKIKLGGQEDMQVLEAIRQETQKPLLIDANEGWTLEQAQEYWPQLEMLGVRMLEQPLPREDLEGYRSLRESNPTAIPLFADEGVQGPEDVERWAGVVDGINIKLAKCGGLLAARQMIQQAQRHGLRLMLGCMVESSLGVSAAAHLAPLVEFADLDGAELIANDPFEGLALPQGQIILPDRPGIGAALRSNTT